MKKRSVLLLMIVLILFGGNAYSRGKVDLGFKMGGGLSGFLSDSSYHYDMKLNYSLGIFASLNFLEFMVIQPELNLISKGAMSEFDMETWYEKFKYNLTYLEIPLLAKYNINLQGFFPYFLAGPYFSVLLSQKMSFKAGVPGETPTTDENVDIEDFKKIDMGFLLGFGADFYWQAIRFTFEARYTMGVLNISESDYYKIRNHVLMICLGAGFTI